MAIHRTQHNKNNPYVMLNKGFLEDPELSAKAKGILAYLLSRPDGWVTQTEQLVSVMKDGLESIKSGLKELEKSGYLKRSPVRDGSGRITHWVKDVFEQPTTAENMLSPQVGFPQVGFPQVGFPQVAKPDEGKPDEGKPTPLINKDEVTIDSLINDTEIAPPEPGAPPTQDSLSVLDKNQKPSTEEEVIEHPSPSLINQPTLIAESSQSPVIESSATLCDNNADKYYREVEHPVAIQERWFRGDHRKPDWAEKRIGSKWIAKREFVLWYAAKEGKSGEYAMNYLQKDGEGDRTQLIWEAYQSALTRESSPVVPVEIATEAPAQPKAYKQSPERAASFKQKLLEKKADVR